MLPGKEADNSKWYDAIKKEKENLNRLNMSKYHPNDKAFSREEGWQKAPLQMIYDIRSEGHRDTKRSW